MNRQDKIRFLKELQAGKVSITSLLPTITKHWYGIADGIWKDEQGNIVPESQIIAGNNIHNIFHVDSGIPLATREEYIDATPIYR